MKKRIILIALLLAILSQITFAQDERGVQVKVRNQQGETVVKEIYEGSYALVIGAIDYEDAGWVSLRGVRSDVEAVTETLQRQGFKVEQFLNPTSANLNLTIRSFVGRYGSKSDNRILIYFAGHGFTETDECGIQRGYIVAVDAPSPEKKPYEFFAKATTMSDIESFVLNIRSKHALFIFDSCFSGTLISRNAISPPKYISYLTEKPVRQFITAGTADQTVPDESVFRRMFVKALDPNDSDNADKNGDGYVTGTELSLYLEEKVIYYRGKAQTPQYGKLRDPRFDQGDFVFAINQTFKVKPMTNTAVLKEENILPKPSDETAQIKKEENPRTIKAGTIRKNSIGMEFVYIPSGEFMMVSPPEEEDRKENEGPQRKIIFNEGFWMGKHEVTQEQYEQIMGKNPSNFDKKCGAKCPVEQVSWYDAKEFIDILNAKNDGFKYSLPTESEWEYAARAGTTTVFAFGDTLTSDQANFNGKPYGKSPKSVNLGKTTPVGSYKPNAWGLYDMHGNVWEWVLDDYQDSYIGLPTDGTANLSQKKSRDRVIRGGAWGYSGDDLRSAKRSFFSPFTRYVYIGFRVVARPSAL